MRSQHIGGAKYEEISNWFPSSPSPLIQIISKSFGTQLKAGIFLE